MQLIKGQSYSIRDIFGMVNHTEVFVGFYHIRSPEKGRSGIYPVFGNEGSYMLCRVEAYLPEGGDTYQFRLHQWRNGETIEELACSTYYVEPSIEKAW